MTRAPHPMHKQRDAARRLGRLVGRGLLTADECLPSLFQAASVAYPSGDPTTIYSFLADTIDAAAVDQVQHDCRMEAVLADVYGMLLPHSATSAALSTPATGAAADAG